MRAWLLALTLVLVGAVHAADVSGTLTILEGQALVYRGTGRVHAAEGVRLAQGDIVQTAASTFAQIELPDRSVIQLGPTTRLMFQAPATRQKPEPVIYLLDGWLKLVTTGREGGAGLGFELRAPQFEVPASKSVAVLHATPTELRLFVESGGARVGERQKAGQAVIVALRAGDYYQRKPPARGNVVSAVPAAFIEAVPRAFRDSLPSRLERFSDRPVAPKEASAFAYADVEDWLKAEPAVRRSLMQRWRFKAADSAFRAALVANLSSHPEWDPILFPEKYKPKDPSVPPRPGGDSQARAASAARP